MNLGDTLKFRYDVVGSVNHDMDWLVTIPAGTEATLIALGRGVLVAKWEKTHDISVYYRGSPSSDAFDVVERSKT